MDTLIDGIECRKISIDNKSPTSAKRLHAIVPLEWLQELPPRSGMAKVCCLLWAYGVMSKRTWFTVSNRIFSKYNISAARKNTILQSLVECGCIELRTSPGKAYQIRIVKPEGWK
jgi:hypothetical protein